MQVEYSHKVSVNYLDPKTWVPDESSEDCYSCKGIFTAWSFSSIRRHHCRTCGNLVCDYCSRERINLNDSIDGSAVKMHRICVPCRTYLQIRKSGDRPENIADIINQCLSTYNHKWNIIRTLIDAHTQILQKIANKSDPSFEVEINVTINGETQSLTLNAIEESLKCQRSGNMVFFIGLPPRHNPKLSPFTRHILLITHDSRIFLTSPLSPDYPLQDFIPSVIDTTTDTDASKMGHKSSLDNVAVLSLNKLVDSTLDVLTSNEDIHDSPDLNQNHTTDATDDTNLSSPRVQPISFQFYSKLIHLQQTRVTSIPEEFAHIPQFPKNSQIAQLFFSRFDLLNLNLESNYAYGGSTKPSSKRNLVIKSSNNSPVKNQSRIGSKSNRTTPKLQPMSTPDKDISMPDDDDPFPVVESRASIEIADDKQLCDSSAPISIPDNDESNGESVVLPSNTNESEVMERSTTEVITESVGVVKSYIGSLLQQSQPSPDDDNKSNDTPVTPTDTTNIDVSTSDPNKSQSETPNASQSNLSTTTGSRPSTAVQQTPPQQPSMKIPSQSLIILPFPLHCITCDTSKGTSTSPPLRKLSELPPPPTSRPPPPLECAPDTPDFGRKRSDDTVVIPRRVSLGDKLPPPYRPQPLPPSVRIRSQPIMTSSLSRIPSEDVVSPSHKNNTTDVQSFPQSNDLSTSQFDTHDFLNIDVEISKSNSKEDDNDTDTEIETETDNETQNDDTSNELSPNKIPPGNPAPPPPEIGLFDRLFTGKGAVAPIPSQLQRPRSTRAITRMPRPPPATIHPSEKNHGRARSLQISRSKSARLAASAQKRSHTIVDTKDASLPTSLAKTSSLIKFLSGVTGWTTANMDSNGDNAASVMATTTAITTEPMRTKVVIDSEIAKHPQYHMFTEPDWKCLHKSYSKPVAGTDSDGGSALLFDACQDLLDVLTLHRLANEERVSMHMIECHRIIELMGVSVSWDTPEHARKLEILWNDMIPQRTKHDSEFSGQPNEYWKSIGFQGADPCSDFRGMGEYALDCLVYFAEHYPDYSSIIFEKTRSADNYYPICASFINLVNLVMELTNIRNLAEMDPAQYPSLFKLFCSVSVEEYPFCEMFCLLARVFDNVWRATKSFYWDFPKLYTAFRERIQFMLTKDPISLAVLMEWIESDTFIFEYKNLNIEEMDKQSTIAAIFGDPKYKQM